MSLSENVKNVLIALEYNPKIFSEETGVSLYKSKKIFSGNYEIRSDVFFAICNLTGIRPEVLYGKGSVRS